MLEKFLADGSGFTQGPMQMKKDRRYARGV